MNRNLAAVSFALILTLLLTAQVVHSATFNPTTTQELIDDITTSNSNGEDDTVNLVPGMIYTITGAETGVPFNDGSNGDNGLPIILADAINTLTINGNGATIQRDPALFTDPLDPCSGAGIKFRIFQIGPVTNVVLDNVIIKNGCGNAFIWGGGALFNSSGNVTITHSELSNNSIIGGNCGGGIDNAGDLTIDNSIVSDNSTTGNKNGAGVCQSSIGTMIIRGSTISGNFNANAGGGIYNAGQITVISSTVSGNTANFGAGISALGGSVTTITNTTISDNDASGALGGGINNNGDLKITACTIANNMAGNGGGIYNSIGSSDIKNSLIVGNTGTTFNNCQTASGTINDIGGNISDDNTDDCAFAFDMDFDVLTMLGSLGDYGGPTFTHSLIQPLIGPANPAIDAILAANCTDQQVVPAPVTEDQRGVPRIFGDCDVGAFEAPMLPLGFTETQKIFASDMAVDVDEFGRSASISGDYAIVGSRLGNGAVVDSGTAYIFERDSMGNWSEVLRLFAADGQFGDVFGWRVSISGDYAIVGAHGENTGTGSAHIYERDAMGMWNFVQELTASDAATGDRFGWSVSLSGERVLIGARNAKPPVPGNSFGAAYIFERNAMGVWTEIQKLTASDGADFDAFGESVSISGDRAVIAAPLAGAGNPGKAYIFERNAMGVWNEVKILTASDAAADDVFGKNVSISGDTAIVGANGDDDNGAESGSAYIFERNGAGVWNEIQKINPSDGNMDDQFGIKVSISGDRAIFGVNLDDDLGGQTGSAYIFERDAMGTWNELQKLNASDFQVNDGFGWNVSIDGDRAVVGAIGDDDNGQEAGAAYMFELQSTLKVLKETTPDGALDFSFTGTGFPAGCELNGNFLMDDDQLRFCDVFPGTYTIEESLDMVGFGLTTLDCFGASPLTTTTESVMVDLQPYDVTLCIFTNEILPPPTLDPLDPSQAGTVNTITSSGHAQNGLVTYIYSFNLNSPLTSARSLEREPDIVLSPSGVTTKLAPDDICNGLQTTLIDPRILTTVQADGNGDASLLFNIPENAAGVTVFLQAVDITNCEGSNVNEELIVDVAPPVLLPMSPGTAGVQNQLNVSDATPTGDVTVIWSFTQQAGVDGSSICPGLLVDILNFRTLFTIQADLFGNASSNVFVPISASGVTVVLQAVDVTTCTPSNVDTEIF